MSNWVKPEQVNEQGDWWWWTEEMIDPLLVSVSQSGHKPNCSYFVTRGQYGWEDAREMVDLGGYWKRVKHPKAPVLDAVGFCTLCSYKVPTFDGLTCCPRCETTGKPCAYEDQLTVDINYHELRVLVMWAEWWADKHASKEAATEDDKRMPDVVKAIAARLRPQLPEGKRQIAMRDEFSELAEKFPNFQTNHPADEGEHPTAAMVKAGVLGWEEPKK